MSNRIEQLEQRIEALEHLDRFNRDLIGDLDLDQIRQDALRENKIKKIHNIEKELIRFKLKINQIIQEIERLKKLWRNQK